MRKQTITSNVSVHIVSLDHKTQHLMHNLLTNTSILHTGGFHKWVASNGRQYP